MDEVSKLVLAVDSSQVRRAKGDLDKLGTAGRNAEKSAGLMASAFRGLASALSVAAASQALRVFVAQADAYANLNARLSLVTKSTREFAAAQTALFGISQRTGTGLEQTTDLFGSLSRSTESLGVSQNRVLSVTQTINQALAVSGTSAQGAAAALVQLGQGFAAGALRGEELNSVLEQAPRLARAIADGLGVSVGELRKLGEQGKLTGEQVFQALERSARGIEDEFGRLPQTVGRAVTQAQNSILAAIGEFDKAAGIATTLAAAIVSLSRDIDENRKRFDEARRAGKGFFETLRNEQLRLLGFGEEDYVGGLNKRLAELNSLLDTPRRLTLFSGQANELETERKALQATLDAIRKASGRPANEGGGRYVPAASNAPAKIGPISEAERYLESLRRQLEATQDLSEADKVLAELQSGRLKLAGGVTREQLLGYAVQIDAAKALGDAQREASEQAQEFLRAAAEERRALAEDGQQVFEATRTEAENLAAQQARLNELVNAGAISWDTYGRASIKPLQDSVAQMEQLFKTLPTLNAPIKELGGFAEQAGRNIQDALGSGLERALAGNFSSIGRIWADTVRKMVAQAAAAQLNSYLFGDTFGQKGGSIGGVVGDFLKVVGFGGARANGGPVQAGRAYLVGERGPEIFAPSGGGTVIPNGAMGPQITYAPVFNFSEASAEQMGRIRAVARAEYTRFARQMSIQGAN